MKVFGEIFRGGADDAVKAAILNSVEGYLQSRIFKHHGRKIKAVGFKIFYKHPVYDHDGKVWQYLRGMDDLKVIHLRRENILRALVSMKIAKKTDIWKESNGSKDMVDKQVELTLDECSNYFEQTRKWEQEANDRFADHHLMELTYEELTSNYQMQMRTVQEFLGVEPMELQPMTAKQNPEALSELIVNYEELKTHFSGTEWGVFFSPNIQ
jgi:LPS sulfotransferase NodH